MQENPSGSGTLPEPPIVGLKGLFLCREGRENEGAGPSREARIFTSVGHDRINIKQSNF